MIKREIQGEPWTFKEGAWCLKYFQKMFFMPGAL